MKRGRKGEVSLIETLFYLFLNSCWDPRTPGLQKETCRGEEKAEGEREGGRERRGRGEEGMERRRRRREEKERR